MPTPRISVAAYLTQQIALSNKPQTEIAAECGYPNSNIIAMFKAGKTKVPLVAIYPLSKSLGIDAGFFLRLAMMEYMPEAWEALESILASSSLVTDEEVRLIHILREGASGRSISASDNANRADLASLAQLMADRDQAKADAAVDALNRLPRNARNR